MRAKYRDVEDQYFGADANDTGDADDDEVAAKRRK